MMITGKTLFAFVDSQDPFTPSVVAGVEQAGPILSLMASRPFDFLFLFYTPHTQTNAHETSREVGRRHPECEVVLQELPDSDPEDPFAFIRQLSRRVGQAIKRSRGSKNHVCMSSGAPEMRAALFFLVAAGVLPATLLHVGSRAERLLDPPDAKEVDLDAPDRSSLGAGPPDIEAQMELLEAELAPARAGRYPELDDTLKKLKICIRSAVMHSAAETVAKAAPFDVPIFLLGERGTGKELFAKLVRQLSDRRDKAFVPVNCAGLAEHIVENELFGHVRGAFTGAETDRLGKFEAADKGTLFLDEIGDLKLEAQAKFFRALQEKEITRLGSNEVRKVDVRIIAATNRNLQEMMEAGLFRRDLYDRLKVVQVRLPPLRERREEILPLAVKFLEQFNQEHNCQKRLSKVSISRLLQHDWPGNVRELKNVLEASVVLAKQDLIEPEDLPIDTTPPGQGYLDHLPVPGPECDMKNIIGKVKARLVQNALSVCNNNQSRAAELLGISRQALSEFLRKPADNAA